MARWPTEKSCLAASIPPRKGAADERRFRVESLPAAEKPVGFRFRELDDKSLVLEDGDKPVLVYNFGVITDPKVPKNDPRGSRACFVHPLYGLNGEVLTESFPKDHYHHHGLFWAWPHILIDGKEYDLWVDKDIRQRFVRWICREAGPVAAVLAVENGWFVGDKKVMIERVWLRAYRPADGERSIDVEIALIPVDKPITLRGAEGKSYGGLNLRFAPRKDTLITVPSGRTKEDLPDTPLAWADLTAQVRRGPRPERRGDLRRSASIPTSRPLAHAALRHPLLRLAGRERHDAPAGRADPPRLPRLDSQGGRRAGGSPAGLRRRTRRGSRR